ncbi:MAG: CBS domain-containing protein, partial [Gammaproteobacteria bacterium]|nr:CBS domain-containing protein [Gammaproteobacteria bacterium]
MRVRDVMVQNVRTAREDDSVRSMAEIIRTDKISGLPVVDENNYIIGLISEKDILKALLPGYTDFLDDPNQALDFQAM